MPRRTEHLHARAATLIFAAAALLQGATRARASSGSIALQRRLDSPFSLRLHKTPLSAVFADIAHKAGISLEVENSVYAALPYGATTRVSATFRNASLRSAIAEILSPLGLRDATSGSHLVIMPSPALARIGRRATWNELQLLQAIRRTQLSTFTGNWTADLRRTLGRSKLTVQIASNNTARAAQAAAKVRAELPTTIAQALDTYASATHQLWFVRRDSVAMMSQHDWLQRQLQRPIVIHFSNVPLETVVTRLGQLSGIRFKPDPGLYLAVPAVSVDSSNGTVQQTLDVLSGAARIAYTVRRHYILLHLAGKTGHARAPRSAIIGTISLPFGHDRGKLDLFLRRSDISTSLYHALQTHLHAAVKRLRRQLVEPPAAAAPAPPPTPPAILPTPKKPHASRTGGAPAAKGAAATPTTPIVPHTNKKP